MYMFLIFSALFECPDVTSGPGQGQVSDRPGSACKVFNSFSLFKLAQILTFDSPWHSSKSNVKWEVLPEGHCPHLDTGHGSSVTLCHKMMFPGPNQVYVTLGHLLPSPGTQVTLGTEMTGAPVLTIPPCYPRLRTRSPCPWWCCGWALCSP